MKIFLSIGLLMVSFNSSFAQKIILYFDVNKTILMEDKASGKSQDQVIAGMLAENCEELFLDWDGVGIKESYYQYLTRTLSLNLSGQELKDNRRDFINTYFYSELQKLDPKLEERAQELREKLLNALEKAKEYYGLVPSFVKFLKIWDQWSQKNPNAYSLVIRTFGEDIEQVIKGFQQATSPNLRLNNAVITFDGQLAVSNLKHPMISMHSFIINSDSPYLFIQDHYERWKKNGFQAAYGKPYPLSDDALSIFFDDNIEGAEDAEQRDIINPFDKEGNFISPQYLIKQGKIVVVDPLEVSLNDDYFIEKISPLLNTSSSSL